MMYVLLRLKIIFFKLISFLNIQDKLKKKINCHNSRYFFYTPNYLNNYREFNTASSVKEIIELFNKNNINI